MNINPYAPPKSNIELDGKLKRSVWWKIYFYPITVLYFVGTISLLQEKSAGLVDYLLLLATIVATVGFFGFVYLKKILFPKFWIVFLVFYIVFGSAYEFFTDLDLREGLSDKKYYLYMFVEFIISLPLFYALFSYGRRKNPIWNKIINQRVEISPITRFVFLMTYIFGVILYICIAVYLRYFYSVDENGVLSRDNILFLIVICSIISALVASYHYNKDIAFPVYHPILLFFKILLSKSTLVPSIFFPLGVYSGHFVFSLIYQQETWRSIFILGSGMLCSLYIVSLLGSFLGIYLLNRRLSPSL